MDMDAVTELADRMRERQQRGEELEHLEFRLGWAALTDEERDKFMSLQSERIAHGKERLESERAQYRALKALLRPQVQRALA